MAFNGNNFITYTTVLALSIIAGFYYYKHEWIPQHHRMNDILAAMLQIEEKEPVNNGVRVAVGYGACRDLFSKANVVVPSPEKKAVKAHHSSIASMDQLQQTYALFFSGGSAAERYVSNKQLFNKIVETAETHPESWDALGGNAPVMASRFAKEGATVLLASRNSAFIAARLAKNITLSGTSAEKESSDIHLILEYAKGETWGGFSAPRANRFIVHSDARNPMIDTAEEFGQKMSSFSPKLFVVSGLQMMDNFPFAKGEQVKRLAVVKDQMIAASNRGSLVHFELASFTELELMKQLSQLIIPNAHSIGMNEQELPNLHSILIHGNVSLDADQSPRVATVLDLMRQVFRVLTTKPGSKLTRLHVHTLAFQAVMVKQGSDWRRNKAGATKAALTATRHVCGNKEISLATSTLLMDDGFRVSDEADARRVMFNAEKPVACWTEEDFKVEICVAPVLVCTAVKQTAGAGDNISAAGLVQQI